MDAAWRQEGDSIVDRNRLSQIAPGPAPRKRRLRAAVLGAVLTAAAFGWVLLGNADRGAGARGRAMASEPPPGSSVEARILVVQDDRERLYSSDQLPPDGRLVWGRFAATRERLGEIYPPEEIAAWVFRVVPEATEIRITLTEHDAQRVSHFEYRREAFSPT
ncbi:hypothetical protein K8I85_01675 [bacterium]|nr:hypothetical protein [bacterium]